jgi:glycosyltransferase involved in cell wall biosynthesis
MTSPRVAICQPYFILGGRLSLVLALVKSLNAMGIEPDILALGYAFSLQQIKQNFGADLRMNLRTIARWTPWRWLPQDFKILAFNRLLKRYGTRYDLLINSSNSQIHLPANPRVLSYIHFPREYRVRRAVTQNYFTGNGRLFSALSSLADRYLERVYKGSHIQAGHRIICNSQYSRECFLDVFPGYEQEIQVIYPPVQMDKYEHPAEKARSGIISLGRFARLKMQLEQIKLAEQLPEIDFHLVGFVTDQAYFERCQNYVEDHHLSNVYLHPNLDQGQMIELLNSSKYFLHTLIDEPFGITAVEAIAAGCIPIVHNSGGQKEICIVPELRYNALHEISAIIRQFEGKSRQEVQEIIHQLQAHARDNFDEPIFDHQITEYLNAMLQEFYA